jgi:hypothetical protein
MLMAALILVGATAPSKAQSTPEMREVLERLDRLERDNASLRKEVQALRQQVAGFETPARDGAVANTTDGQSAAEESSVERARVEEMAQTKVEASQKFPIRVTGMMLFNAFTNGRYNGDSQNPVAASLTPFDQTGGGTVRQTTLGLLYNGPQTFAGGKISGSLYMDFFAGSTLSIDHLFRIRTATINLDWTNTSLMVGQDKPLISPRDPDSLAQVGFSPLTWAGNPWLWQPQFRVEQRFALSHDSGLRVQAGVVQTSLGNLSPGSPLYYSVEESRPGAEGRVEYWRRWGETGRIEIAGGVHVNRNHLGSFSLPSNVYSTDWLVRPFGKLEFTGMFFHGRNTQVLGTLPPGFETFPNGQLFPVPSSGGWGQMKVLVTPRLTFNIYGGEQVNRKSDLISGDAGSNAAYFANFMYRVAPNVIVSLEGGQVRTAYYQIGNRLNDHYDLAIGYIF